MTTAAKAIEQIRTVVAGWSLQLDSDDQPWRLRVGEHAHQLLSDGAGWLSTHRARLLPVLYGVPIETVEPDRGWRLVSRGGDVIAFGEIDDP